MEFYVVQDGKLRIKYWCDNPMCDNYSSRSGFKLGNDARLGIQLISMEQFDFCSEKCQLAVHDQQRSVYKSG